MVMHWLYGALFLALTATTALGDTSSPTPASVGPTPIYSSEYYKFGTGLYPIYQQAASTTANTTNASSTITVASANNIAVGDTIWAAFVPAGTLVTNIVGTRVTMSVNSTATGIGTAVSFGKDRWSAGKTALVDTLGARQGYFGAASRGHSTWFNQYASALDYADVSAVFSLSTTGQAAATFATRDSDNPGGAGAGIIASQTYLISDSNGDAHPSWAQYVESDLVGSAIGTHLQTESSIFSNWMPVVLDPYTPNATGMSVNHRFDCGKGWGTSPQDCSAPLQILNNGASYKSGIIFNNGALATLGGLASAIQLPQSYSIDWFSAAGTKSFRLYADTTFVLNDPVHGKNALFVNTDGGLYLGEAGQAGVVIGAATGNNKGDGTLNVASGGIYDNGTAPTGTAGTGYVRATAPILTDPILSGFAVSTSPLTKTSDTSLATVPGLSVALTAGKTYSCRGHLAGNSSASAGIKVALVGTSGLTATSASFTGALWNGTTAVARSTVTTLASNIAANTVVYTDLDIVGAIVVNTGGTINVQASQNASNGTATTVLPNSTFQCVRVN